MSDLRPFDEKTAKATMERIRQLLSSDGWGIEPGYEGPVASWRRLEARKGALEFAAIALCESSSWRLELYLPSFPNDEIIARTVADVQHTFMQDRRTSGLQISDLGW